jgi:hypothetical protein
MIALGSASMSQIAGQMPTFKSFGVGYVAIDGTKAPAPPSEEAAGRWGVSEDPFGGRDLA